MGFAQAIRAGAARWRTLRGGSPSAGAAAPRRSRRDYEDLRKVNTAILPLMALGFIASIRVVWQAGATGAALLWCFSSLSVGATVGFLFGIPRTGGQRGGAGTGEGAAGAGAGGGGASGAAGAAGASSPNTNLEEVSDWLTKIIVGLTLVNLGPLEERVHAIGRHAAAALHATPTDSDVSSATALVIGFAVVGFLVSYLYTRLFLQGAFSRSDAGMGSFHELVSQEMSNVVVAAPATAGEPVLPSSAERESAERVLKAAPADRPEAVLAPLRALAAEYQSIREAAEYGPARTRRMTEVAGRMKPLALAAAPFLETLSKSDQPGERLAAVVILQMQFDPAYIEWLADRLPAESAFIGYQAVSALLARARVVGPPERARIKQAVQAAQQRGVKPEAQRDRLVERLLEELKDV